MFGTFVLVKLLLKGFVRIGGIVGLESDLGGTIIVEQFVGIVLILNIEGMFESEVIRT